MNNCLNIKTWAQQVLDAYPSNCQNITHGVTTLSMINPVGTHVVISKSAVEAVACGHLSAGSLVFSRTNPGAVVVIIRADGDSYETVVISQPARYAADTEALLRAEPAHLNDSLKTLKEKFNNLLLAVQTALLE